MHRHGRMAWYCNFLSELWEIWDGNYLTSDCQSVLEELFEINRIHTPDMRFLLQLNNEILTNLSCWKNKGMSFFSFSLKEYLVLSRNELRKPRFLYHSTEMVESNGKGRNKWGRRKCQHNVYVADSYICKYSSNNNGNFRFISAINWYNSGPIGLFAYIVWKMPLFELVILRGELSFLPLVKMEIAFRHVEKNCLHFGP